jgi:hypothetical protein
MLRNGSGKAIRERVGTMKLPGRETNRPTRVATATCRDGIDLRHARAQGPVDLRRRLGLHPGQQVARMHVTQVVKANAWQPGETELAGELGAEGIGWPGVAAGAIGRVAVEWLRMVPS